MLTASDLFWYASVNIYTAECSMHRGLVTYGLRASWVCRLVNLSVRVMIKINYFEPCTYLCVMSRKIGFFMLRFK